MTAENETLPIAVIGAGPAGLAAACALRRAGIVVGVFERAPGPPARLPETLYPAAQEELRRLGVGLPPARPVAVRFVSADGAVSMRIEVETAQLPAIDRAALDLALREAALSAGAKIFPGRAVAAVERAADGTWLVTDAAGVGERVRLVIDASGKGGFAAGKLVALDTDSRPLDARSSVFTHFERSTPFDIDGVTLVAAPDGFFYLVPLHARRLCVGRVSYAEGQPDGAAFLAAVAASAPVQAIIDGAKQALPVIPAKNAASRTVGASLPGLFIVGDALGFRDPFLSDGIFRALASGRRAGELAAAVLLGRICPEDAVTAYGVGLQHVERRAALATEAALAPFTAALGPSMLLDPHMPAPLLAAVLGLGRHDAEAGAHTLLRRRRAGQVRRKAA
jgi:clorobiocin biosynthesis protein Clo-hal/FADH2-dependent halogenase